jgi:hypothetical protein
MNFSAIIPAFLPVGEVNFLRPEYQPKAGFFRAFYPQC